MSLFPAYSGSTSRETRIQTFDATVVTQPSTSALDWLKNDSAPVETRPQNEVVVIVSGSESESDVEIVSSPSEVEEPQIVKKLRLDEEAVHGKAKLSEPKAPLGALFLEDLSISNLNRVDRSTAYRIDRSQNRSLVQYSSIFEGHLSKYSSISPLLALKAKNEALVYRIKEAILTKSKKKKRDKRYFDRSELKRLQKHQDLGLQIRKSPISFTSPPLVLKLSPPNRDLETKGEKSATETFDLPYDELKKASIRQKTEEFNRKLNSDPKNIQLWLDFIDFQNDVARFGDAQMTESALFEKKLAILDRALTWNQGNVSLLVEKIKLKGVSAANQDAIAEEWRNIAFVHPNNPEVWWECLMAHCRRFTAFSVDRLQTTFAKCLSTLSDISDGTIKSHKPGPNMEEQMIYIFVALVYILREAGFTERAVVLFQCEIEFALFMPPQLAQLPRQRAIDELELYYSANLSLFGQQGALGWNKWTPSNSKNGTELDQNMQNLEIEDEIDRLVIERAPEGSSKAALWSYVEEGRTARRVLSLPPNAPQSDDPERQVVFDDVSRFLIKVREPENRYRLILMFFEFFGVDIVSCGTTLDTFLKNDSFSSSFSCRNVASSIFKPETGTKPKMIQYDPSIFKEIVDQGYCQVIATLTEPFRTHLICVYVRQEMTSCLQDSTNFEKRAKQVKTVVREILREPANRNNLAVWALCSECELRLGKNAREAVRIADTAINVAHQLKLYASWGALCHLATQTAYFAFKLDSVDLNEQNFDISRITDANVDDPTAVWPMVKVLASCLFRKTIQNQMNDLEKLKSEISEQTAPFLTFPDLPSDEGEQLMPVQPLVCQLAECYALFLYLADRITSKSSNLVPLTSADAVFTSLLNQVDYISKQKKSSMSSFATFRRFLEQAALRLHSARIVMAAFDYRTNIKSITNTKEVVLCALADFPSNRAFLRCLIAIREPAFLSSSFVKFTRSMSHRISHPLAWLSILQALIGKIESIRGAENLVRSFFEKSLLPSKQICWRSSCLWAFYIAFEASSSSKRLESVLFRALQACPWSKEIYLSLARNQGGDVKKLNDAVDMIIEKGLRLHTLVDEMDTFNVTKL